MGVKRLLLALLLLLVASLAAAADAQGGDGEQRFLDFVVQDLEGNDVPLSRFADSPVILVVNVASECGYTDQNYRELQALYEKYKDQGFTVLAFPCNQFGRQEPGGPSDILQFVQNNYHVTFPVFSKVDVNGANAHPLFKFLTSRLAGFVTNDVKWNFSKFLIVDNEPYKRYGSSTSPFALENDVVEALRRTGGAKVAPAHSDDL